MFQLKQQQKKKTVVNKKNCNLQEIEKKQIKDSTGKVELISFCKKGFIDATFGEHQFNTLLKSSRGFLEISFLYFGEIL